MIDEAQRRQQQHDELIAAISRQLDRLDRALTQTLKTTYVKADPEQPDHIERERLPTGEENVFHYATIPRQGINEIIEVQAKSADGTWHVVEDYQLTDQLILLLCGEYRVRTADGTTTSECVRERREFKITYR